MLQDRSKLDRGKELLAKKKEIDSARKVQKLHPSHTALPCHLLCMPETVCQAMKYKVVHLRTQPSARKSK